MTRFAVNSSSECLRYGETAVIIAKGNSHFIHLSKNILFLFTIQLGTSKLQIHYAHDSEVQKHVS